MTPRRRSGTSEHSSPPPTAWHRPDRRLAGRWPLGVETAAAPGRSAGLKGDMGIDSRLGRERRSRHDHLPFAVTTSATHGGCPSGTSCEWLGWFLGKGYMRAVEIILAGDQERQNTIAPPTAWHRPDPPLGRRLALGRRDRGGAGSFGGIQGGHGDRLSTRPGTRKFSVPPPTEPPGTGTTSPPRRLPTTDAITSGWLGSHVGFRGLGDDFGMRLGRWAAYRRTPNSFPSQMIASSRGG